MDGEGLQGVGERRDPGGSVALRMPYERETRQSTVAGGSPQMCCSQGEDGRGAADVSLDQASLPAPSVAVTGRIVGTRPVIAG